VSLGDIDSTYMGVLIPTSYNRREGPLSSLANVRALQRGPTDCSDSGPEEVRCSGSDTVFFAQAPSSYPTPNDMINIADSGYTRSCGNTVKMIGLLAARRLPIAIGTSERPGRW
jgi:hypothetical protein